MGLNEDLTTWAGVGGHGFASGHTTPVTQDKNLMIPLNEILGLEKPFDNKAQLKNVQSPLYGIGVGAWF